jgi:hypothetical protein
MPLVGMAYIQFYVLSRVSGYDLLPKFSETLVMILSVMSISGVILGITAVKMAKKSPFLLNMPCQVQDRDKSNFKSF